MVYVCRFDESRTIEYVSDGSYDLTGYLPGELTQNRKLSFNELIYEDDRARVLDELWVAIQNHASYSLIYRIVTKLGGIQWVQDRGSGILTPGGEFVGLEGMLIDVTEMMSSKVNFDRQVDRFLALRKIDIAITGSSELKVILDVLLDQAINQLQIDAADVLIYDAKTQTLEFIHGRGFSSLVPKHVRLPLGMSFAGLALREHQIIRLTSISNLMKELGRFPHVADDSFQFYLGVPLIIKGVTKGILEIFHGTYIEPDVEWFEFLEALAGQAAIAIENSMLFYELQRSHGELTRAYDATLEGWSRALELRDQGTEGHTQRVTDVSVLLAQRIGLSDQEIVHVRRGALLHDIGKMGIPDKILLKPGPLSAEEWDIMRQHPVYAYELLSTIPNMERSVEIPYCHHERWDGTGYPRGLKGENIPISARIFAVVDVWDALLSNRPYRPAWSRPDTIAYILEQRGAIFQSEIVDAFMGLDIHTG
jgi:putative nucleotidyltransferase with HDIG domain